VLIAAGTTAMLAAVYRPGVLARIRVPIEDWGGQQGIWHDTVKSLLIYVNYGQPYGQPWFAVAGYTIVVGVVLGVVLLTVRTVVAPDARLEAGVPRRELSLCAAIVGVALVGTWLQVFLLGMRYPIDRGALYLVPLFVLGLVLLWLCCRSLRPRALEHACLAAILLLTGHQLACLNLTHTFGWRYDADSRDAVELIAELARPDEGARTSSRVSIHWRCEPAFNYYLEKNRIPWIERVERSATVDERADYFYLFEPQAIERYGWTLQRTFETSGGFVASR
jgi:hypothetical protein